MAELLDRFLGSLLGLAIGDALGAPFEFNKIDKTRNLDMDEIYSTAVKGGLLRYTDDTLMAMYLAEAIIEAGGFDPSIVAEKYYEWYLSGDLRGIGVTTREALRRYGVTRDWRKSGVIRVLAAGNGCAMRVAPIALSGFNKDIGDLYGYVRQDCVITHYNEEAISGAFAVAIAIKGILNGIDKDKVVDEILATFNLFGIKNTVYENLEKTRELIKVNQTDVGEVNYKIGNTGYVAHSVPVAVWAFSIADSYEEAVKLAINVGEDTDTHAAIAGAIAGSFYGLKNIPAIYIEKIENREKLIQLGKNLYEIAVQK